MFLSCLVSELHFRPYILIEFCFQYIIVTNEHYVLGPIS